MKTNLDRTVKTKQEADEFITDLYNNNELFHFDDDPMDCLPDINHEEASMLDDILNDMFKIIDYDPFEKAIELIQHN